MKSHYVCLVDTDKVLGVMMTKDTRVSQIHAFNSLEEGLRYFESAYNKRHVRNYESSMSACIHGISFRSSIVLLTVKQIQELQDKKGLVSVGNVAGNMLLLSLNKSKARCIWESGAKPRLIS